MDVKELRYQIARSGLTAGKLAEMLSIARETFYKRMNGKLEWKLSEVQKIREILELNDETTRQIFFDS
jgi:predicted transcriptional regulator